MIDRVREIGLLEGPLSRFVFQLVPLLPCRTPLPQASGLFMRSSLIQRMGLRNFPREWNKEGWGTEPCVR